MAQQTDHIPDVRKKLTAVEWIEERLTLSFSDEIKDLRGFFVIAKEMEKDQIMNSWVHGIADPSDSQKTAEQYYNETYGE